MGAATNRFSDNAQYPLPPHSLIEKLTMGFRLLFSVVSLNQLGEKQEILPYMYIGEVSKITGVSLKAIRLYEEKGLLQDVARSGKYRIYDHTHIQAIELIKEAKALGFKLSEMKNALDAGQEDNIWRSLLHAIRHRKGEIKKEIKRLDDIYTTLAKYEHSIDTCLSENPECDLPLKA